MKSLLVLRTHRFDSRTADEVRRLRKTGLPVIVAADERHSPVDTGGFPKVSLTEDNLVRLRLPSHPNIGWLCGDYGLYLAADYMPNVDFYWSIDRDVRINFEDPSEFFSVFDDDETDFLAARHELAPDTWYWRPRMEPHRSPVYQAFFPVVRLSRRAVLHLLDARRRLSDVPHAAFPNDESFVASILANDGFTCGAFRQRGDFFPYRTFGFRRLISGSLLDQKGPDNLVYHAVLYGDDFAEKAFEISRWKLTPNHVTELLENARAEMSPERHAELAAKFGPAEGEATSLVGRSS